MQCSSCMHAHTCTSTCMTHAMPAGAHRQSKLTAALRDAIGGNANTVMIANLWPTEAHLEECVSTLRFAARVRCLQTDAQVWVGGSSSWCATHRPGLLGMQRGEQFLRMTAAERCKVDVFWFACSSQQGSYSWVLKGTVATTEAVAGAGERERRPAAGTAQGGAADP